MFSTREHKKFSALRADSDCSPVTFWIQLTSVHVMCIHYVQYKDLFASGCT